MILSSLLFELYPLPQDVSTIFQQDGACPILLNPKKRQSSPDPALT